MCAAAASASNAKTDFTCPSPLLLQCYPSNGIQACKQWDLDCLECDTATKCAQCKLGYSIVGTGRVSPCSSSDVCVACGFVLLWWGRGQNKHVCVSLSCSGCLRCLARVLAWVRQPASRRLACSCT